jgi:hypothetical protein
MTTDLFRSVFPFFVIIIYLCIKIYVDNKNSKTPWYEEVFSFPMDIIFLGIAYVSGIMLKGLELSLLGVVLIFGCLFFSFITKSLTNFSITVYYGTDGKGKGWSLCILNYMLSITLVVVLYLNYN